MKYLGASISGGVQLNFWRFFIGGLFLWLLAKNKLIPLKLVPKIALLALLFIVISMSCYQLAINESSAFFVAVIFSMNPLFSKLLEHFFDKDTRSSLKNMLLPLFGMGLVLLPNLSLNKFAVLLALLSSMIFALYSWLNKRLAVTTDYDTIILTAYTFLIGVLELFILSIFSSWVTSHDLIMGFFATNLVAGIHPEHLPSLLFLSIVVTAGGFLLYFLCQRYYSTLSPVVFFSKPAVSLLFSMVFLDEPVSLIALVGIMMIVIGNLSSLRRYGDDLR